MDTSGRVAKGSSRTDSYDNSDVMTLSEIARYLKVSEKTILRMVQAAEIPGAKVSNQWRFLRPLIDDWLSSRMLTAPNEDLVNVIRTANPIIPLSRLISPDRVVMDLQPGTKEAVLSQLVQPLTRAGMLADPEDFLKQLLEREEIVSTGIDEGVAIPHALDPEKSGVKETCIVLGICKEGTKFKALIGGKTFIFCLLCADSVVAHLRLVAKTTLLFRVRDMVKECCAASSVDEVIRILTTVDASLGKEAPVKPTP